MLVLVDLWRQLETKLPDLQGNSLLGMGGMGNDTF